MEWGRKAVGKICRVPWEWSQRKERPQKVLCSRAGDESGELELEDKNGTKVSLLDCMARGFPWKECLQA